ncbi:MAG: hypothetical protein R3B06_05010 [Kofleriaceae bacterium]
MKHLSFAMVCALAACGNSSKSPPPVAEPAAPAPDPGGGGRIGAFPCEPAQLLGTWQADSGSDFESIAFADGGGFVTYLHDRMMYNGEWELVDGALVLSSDAYGEVAIDGVRCAPTAVIGTDRASKSDVRWSRGGAAPAPTE